VVLIGTAGSHRTELLRAALQREGVRLHVVEWRALLESDDAAGRHLSPHLQSAHAWCKIDSPGADPAVTDALIERGWRLAGQPTAGPCLAPWPLEHGELAFRHWWFEGLTGLLRRIDARLASLRRINPVSEILLMCDKWVCQQYLQARGVPVPALLGEVRSFEQMEAQLPVQEHPAIFIKARYGSSAAGVIALRRHPDGRIVAYTSARTDPGGRLYSHLRISRLTARPQIAALVDALAVQGTYAESWIPKPRLPGEASSPACYDLRVVAGRTAQGHAQARQRIARVSESPLTNLHLGNRREPPRWLDAGQTAALEQAVEHAAAAFPGSHSIGFDINLQPRGPCFLEANAFGDLLPGLRHPEGADGVTTYEDQARLVSADER
jgi:hypothetical protein